MIRTLTQRQWELVTRRTMLRDCHDLITAMGDYLSPLTSVPPCIAVRGSVYAQAIFAAALADVTGGPLLDVVESMLTAGGATDEDDVHYLPGWTVEVQL